MTPAARLAAAIELLDAIGSAHRKPADAIANDFFRSRRFIGSGDRRAVADRVWRVLRAHRRLRWWLTRREGVPSARLLAAASLLLEGWTMAGLVQAFAGGAFGAAPLNAAERATLAGLEGQRLDSSEMPEAVRLEIADWLLEPLRARFGAALEDELAALAETAPLDLRVNLLKTTREAAAAALAAEGIETAPMPLSPWGLRVATRPAVSRTAALQDGGGVKQL
jgi:16S rRNA (cytosine967-C5)-methyltransferase